MIDEFIERSKEMPISAKGSNKKCYLFDNYALLCGSFVDEEQMVQKKIKQLKALKEQGVNVVCLLETKNIDNINYELQEKAQGEALFPFSLKNSENGELNYLKTLVSINSEDLPFYEKMVCDWNTIMEFGLDIDPSKCTNFFYQKGSISFIDLSVMKLALDERKKYQYKEMASVLHGGGLLWLCKSVYPEANQVVSSIYKKLGMAVLNTGGNIQEYIQQVDNDSQYHLDQYFSSYLNDSNHKTYNR